MQSKNAKQKCEARMQSKNKNESFEFARHVEADQIKNFLLAVTETLDMALYVYNLPRRAPSKTRRRSLKQIFYEYPLNAAPRLITSKQICRELNNMH